MAAPPPSLRAFLAAWQELRRVRMIERQEEIARARRQHRRRPEPDWRPPLLEPGIHSARPFAPPEPLDDQWRLKAEARLPWWFPAEPTDPDAVWIVVSKEKPWTVRRASMAEVVAARRRVGV